MKLTRLLTYFLCAIPFIIFILLVSLPTLHAGFYYDDIFNSQVRGLVEIQKETLWDFIKARNYAWMLGGRIYPITLSANYVLYYLLPNTVSFHIALAFFIWLSLFSVAWLITLITKQIKPALLFLLIIPAFWCIRDSHDALTGYGILLPFVTLFITLSLSFFIKYIENSSWYLLGLSLFFYCCGLLTYEIGITAFPALFVLAWMHFSRIRKSLIVISPYVIVTLLYFLICFFIRHQSKAVYDGISVGTFYPSLRGIVMQFIAVFPLSYWMPRLYLLYYLPIKLQEILPLFFISFLSSVYLLKALSLSNKQKYNLIMLGLIFMLVPAFLVGISEKYQQWLTWGMGYLPVYLQYIGLSLICIAFLTWLKSRIARIFSVLILSSLTCVMFTFNTFIIEAKNDVYLKPRRLVEHALRTRQKSFKTF